MISVVRSSAVDAVPATRPGAALPTPVTTTPDRTATEVGAASSVDELEPGDCPTFRCWWLWAASLGALDSPAGPGVGLCLL